MLKKLLTPDMVVLDAEGLATPPEVLRYCGGLMVQAGKVSQAYVEEIVDGYNTIGPYFVMSPGVALPHARPSNKVHQSGVCFVRLKEPVAFNHPENDPVRLVFVMAGSENDGHLDMIEALGSFLCDEEKLRKLYTVANYEELYALL